MVNKLTRREFIQIAEGGGVSALLLPSSPIHYDTNHLQELRWIVRSDLINARRDVTPRAVGDGMANDTSALQACLDSLSDQPGGRNTLYLPAGVYRITRTLKLSKRDGISILGRGRNTRIVWDGPGGTGDDSRMFWCEGSPRSRFVGIIWDGNQRAYVGFDHDSHSLFETVVDHSCEAFIDFAGSGFRVRHDQSESGAQAAAETSITNCLFERCGRGIALLQFNDYNFTIAAADFVSAAQRFTAARDSWRKDLVLKPSSWRIMSQEICTLQTALAPGFCSTLRMRERSLLTDRKPNRGMASWAFRPG